jgi:hypothetical protein
LPEVGKFSGAIKAKYGANGKSVVPNGGLSYDMIKLYAKAVKNLQL